MANNRPDFTMAAYIAITAVFLKPVKNTKKFSVFSVECLAEIRRFDAKAAHSLYTTGYALP